jgi:Rrf2 family iron-sulfur cluster assembly transcriptional regulator
MQTILKISEAAAIGLHAADYLARHPALASTQDIAAGLGVSYNHLSKVLQQLTKAGLVTPVRGPKGGFTLSPSGKKASVRELMGAIDGPIKLHTCLMGTKVCRRSDCMFGRFLAETNKRFEAVLNSRISVFSKRK